MEKCQSSSELEEFFYLGGITWSIILLFISKFIGLINYCKRLGLPRLITKIDPCLFPPFFTPCHFCVLELTIYLSCEVEPTQLFLYSFIFCLSLKSSIYVQFPFLTSKTFLLHDPSSFLIQVIITSPFGVVGHSRVLDLVNLTPEF